MTNTVDKNPDINDIQCDCNWVGRMDDLEVREINDGEFALMCPGCHIDIGYLFADWAYKENQPMTQIDRNTWLLAAFSVACVLVYLLGWGG